MNIYKSIKVSIFLVAGSILILAPNKQQSNQNIDTVSTTIIKASFKS
jgi:hypothetical protein